jgi:hypothetical protein
MTDFDYKKYSLENLEKWIEDALSSAEASPQEIYDTIHKVVSENYYHHKHHASRAYELMEKLNGGVTFISCDKDDKSPECQKAWSDFWEENYYPEESSQYTEEELNAMCDKAASDQEKEKCREYNLREAEYYDKRAELDSKWKSVSVPSKPLYVSEDGDVWIPDSTTKEDKVVKWILPVELDGLSGECYIELPDDLLEVANLKEGDTIEWIDRKDGSFEMRKVTK